MTTILAPASEDRPAENSESTGLNLPTIQAVETEAPVEAPVEPVEPPEEEAATLTPTIVKVPVSSTPVEPTTEAEAVIVEEATETVPVPEPVETVEPETTSAESDLSGFPTGPIFVSAGTFPPFSDGDGNGLMTDIVAAALLGSEYIGETSTNAVSQPFDPLMASSDPDVILSYPWINPDCANAAILSARSADLCNNYAFSEKTYDIVMTFFVADRSGLAQASDASEFAGKRICVPEQYPTNHLAAAGFNSSRIEIARGDSVAECMSKLLSGQTDVVNADYLSVESTYAVLNSQSIIVENPSFTWIRSVHAIANKDNPAALQTLSDFDDGLRRIRESGEWQEIVTPYIE